eukprot:g49211.t1
MKSSAKMNNNDDIYNCNDENTTAQHQQPELESITISLRNSGNTWPWNELLLCCCCMICMINEKRWVALCNPLPAFLLSVTVTFFHETRKVWGRRPNLQRSWKKWQQEMDLINWLALSRRGPAWGPNQLLISDMAHAHQDWEERVLTKRGPGPKLTKNQQQAAARTGQADTVKKFGGGANKVSTGPTNAAKLDDNEAEDFKHKSIPTEFKKALMQARMAKKLTQAQLATQINSKQSVIQSYENGTAIPDGQIISKLNRALGTRLPKISKPKPVSE